MAGIDCCYGKHTESAVTVLGCVCFGLMPVSKLTFINKAHPCTAIWLKPWSSHAHWLVHCIVAMLSKNGACLIKRHAGYTACLRQVHAHAWLLPCPLSRKISSWLHSRFPTHSPPSLHCICFHFFSPQFSGIFLSCSGTLHSFPFSAAINKARWGW